MGKYNDSESDKYLLENNLLGLQTIEELVEAEALVFSLRAAELERNEHYFESFSENQLKQLHYYLFQDIYTFAGQYREVQLMKGSTRFCQVQHIEDYAADLFHQLQREPAWHSLDEAAARLAYFKAELNMLHPFREGNGRTIRIFLHAYALSRSVTWHYENMEKEEYIQAMIQSVTNLDLLTKLFRDTISFNEQDSHDN